MITEDYVSFKTAKLLKEKGFDELSIIFYSLDGNGEIALFDDEPLRNSEIDGYAKVTHQMAMKWLREVHNIAIETEWEHLWYAYIKPMTSNPTEDDYYQCSSAKYEEAIEAAIKYCLENLI